MLLTGGHIYPIEREPFYGDILIRDGNIADIGEHLPYPGEKKIDLEGAFVVPGFIDISTNLGLHDAGHRTEEGSAISPSEKFQTGTNMIDGINWDDEYFEKGWKNGVTTVVVNSPYNRPLGGQSCALKTAGKSPLNRVLNPFIDMHGTLGNRGKNDYNATRTSPLSRMGIARGLRDHLSLTHSQGPESRTFTHSEKQAVEALRTKQVPLKLSAAQQQDILSAINLAEELGFSLILDDVVEYLPLLPLLKDKNIPLTITSLLADASAEHLRERNSSHAALLEKNGIPFSLTSHHPETTIELFHLSACLLAREGVSEKTVLEAITINPAKALGLDSRIGSLAKGKDADILVFDGNPLYSLSTLKYVLIDGEIL